MIPPNIKDKMGRNLHLKPNHPLEIVKKAIYTAFHGFERYETFGPVVTIEDNFDNLLIPKDHPSRSPKDTYYVDDTHVLRTHTSAHQNLLIGNNHNRFLVAGDVYRRDAIDRTHYPVFHQIEGVALFNKLSSPIGPQDHLSNMMKDHLTAMVEKVFCKYGKAQLQPVPAIRFVDSYFPFTTPSWELEIDWHGEWLEVAGCGMVHPDVLKLAQCENMEGWAFGLGLERLAMLVFNIPDIRLFWSEDERFFNQFMDLDSRFRPFSLQPNCYKDVAFWLPDKMVPNDVYEVAREEGGDLIESVSLIDEFEKAGRKSHCYRINYRAMDRTLTNEEINTLQDKIRKKLELLGAEIR